MSNTAKKRVHLACGIVISLLLFMTGLLLCIKCYGIYKIGVQPFTYENIGKAFSQISVIVYITLFAIASGVVVHTALPVESERVKAKRSQRTICEGFAQKADVSLASDKTQRKIARERIFRKDLKIFGTVLFVLSAVLPLIYLLNPANFPAVPGGYNKEVLKGIVFYIVCLIPLVVYEFIYMFVSERSYARESALLKKVISKHGVSKNPVQISKTKLFFAANEKPIVLGIRIAFLICGVAFVVIGINNGGMNDVLQKAINICAECIGLG